MSSSSQNRSLCACPSPVFKVTALAALAALACGSPVANEGLTSLLASASDGGATECSQRKCSSDLRQVIDGCDSTTVLESCAIDQACGDGRCIDACEAAAFAQGSIGCEFVALPPDDFYDKYITEATINIATDCFAAYIANTWPEAVTIAVDYDGRSLDIGQSTFRGGVGTDLTPLAGPLDPGAVAIVFLSTTSSTSSILKPCPGPAALATDPISHGTSITKAFRITTSRPVSAYSIFPFSNIGGDGAASTLLTPVTSWSRTNILVNGYPSGADLFAQIVASKDDTHVVVTPRVPIGAAPGIDGVFAGDPAAFTLAAGQVLQLTQSADLTGSFVSSDEPVAVFGGDRCTGLPSRYTPACDYLDQQIPPPSEWGTEYALVPCRSRWVTDELTTYRLVGAVDGTELTYDSLGAIPFDVPKTIRRGESYLVRLGAPTAVRSQDSSHPFYAAAYLSSEKGAEAAFPTPAYPGPIPVNLGDPEFVNLVPSEQFLERYVFYMDPSYSSNFIAVVRRRGVPGFAPVEVECGGEFQEVADFHALGRSGQFELAYYGMDGVAGQRCGAGRHEGRSAEPFAVYVWGLAPYASYGYAGGRGLRPLFDIPAQPLR